MQQVFVCGCPRSGTTMLGAMLGTHSRCIATPESSFLFRALAGGLSKGKEFAAVDAIRWMRSHPKFKFWRLGMDSDATSHCVESRSVEGLFTWLVREYARRRGKPDADIWIDHTPAFVLRVSTIVTCFPAAKILHLVRDGRAAAASVIKLDWGPNTVAQAAKWWLSNVAHGLAAEALFGNNKVMRVHYERLVLNPAATLQEICRFAQIDFQPEMVSGQGFEVPQFSRTQHVLVGQTPCRDRLNDWERVLSTRQVEIFESIAMEMLSGLGYELKYGICARKQSKSERICYVAKEISASVINRWRHYRRINTASRDASPEPSPLT